MARIIGTTNLSWAEETIAHFLHSHKGKEFTPQEIQEQTGIRADFVNPIMDNLRWKGYEVGSRGGKHFFIHNTWRAYLVGGAMVATILSIFLIGWLR